MSNKVIEWAKSHPWEAGGAGFLVVIVGFFVLSSGKGSAPAASGPDANLAAYLSAETAQSQMSDALTAVQYQTDASTAQAGIAANEQISVNNTWAASDLASTQNNNATSISNNLITGLSNVANNLGTVLTNSSSSGSASSNGGSSFLWGLFGSGPSASQSGSSSQQQSFVGNSQQAAAEAELAQIANENFHIGH